MAACDGVPIGLKLAHNHVDDAAMVLRCDAVLDFLEWKARGQLHNGSSPLQLLSFPRKA